MNKLLKSVFFSLIGAVTIVGAWFFVNQYIYRSRAGGDDIKVYFDSTTITAIENQSFEFSVMLEGDPTKKVSAAKLEVEYDKSKLAFAQVSSTEEANACNKLETQVQLVNDTTGTNGKITWTKVAIKPDSELPSGLFCFGRLSFNPVASGSATISIPADVSNFEIGGPNGAYVPVPDTAKSAIEVSVSPSGATVTPEPTVPTLNFSVKLQGIIGKPTGADTLKVRVTVAKADASFLQVFNDVEVTASIDGIWSAALPLTGVTQGSGYYIRVKGPKHVQQRYCHLVPAVAAVGAAYVCGTSTITLNAGVNTADFTAVSLLVGDLPPQDSVLNSRDTADMRLYQLKTDQPALDAADVNYDTVVNSVDYSLLIQSMQVKYDED